MSHYSRSNHARSACTSPHALHLPHQELSWWVNRHPEDTYLLPHPPPHQEMAWRANRPPEETYLLPRRNRELGMLYMGAQERVRLMVHKLITGE